MQHIHITGIPQSPTEPIWICEFVAWRVHKLLPDPRFRSVTVANVYLDYLAVLTVEEALEINARNLDVMMEHWRQKNEDLNRLLLAHRYTHPMVFVRIVDEDSID